MALKNMMAFLVAAESTGASRVSEEAHKIVDPILMIIAVIVGIIMTVLVLMQKSTDGNVGAITGSQSETFYDKGKSGTKESKLKRATVALAVILVLIAVIFFILKAI